MRIDLQWRPTTEHFLENARAFSDEIEEMMANFTLRQDLVAQGFRDQKVEEKGEMAEIFHRSLRMEVHEG
jgi:hypothetical protein